jgi:hypothetical protein
MPKRSISELDWGDSQSHCPQSKIQVGNREINQGICSASNMKAVYSKSFPWSSLFSLWWMVIQVCIFLVWNTRKDIESSFSRLKGQTKSTGKHTNSICPASNKSTQVFSNHYNSRWTDLTPNRTATKFLPHYHLIQQLHVVLHWQFQCPREVQILWGNLLW